MLTSLYKGERICLAAPREEDAAVMAAWYQDSDYERNLDTDFVRPRSQADIAAESVPDHVIEFRVRLLSDDTLIGFVALHNIEWASQIAKTAIGIGDPAYRGKGYAEEAMRLVLQYAFCELNLHRVGLDVIAYNERAIRLYERIGFTVEGRERERVYRDNARHDLIFMGILRHEWFAR